MYFKVLVDRVSRSEHTNAEVQGESLKLKEQLDALMLSRSDFENSLKVGLRSSRIMLVVSDISR